MKPWFLITFMLSITTAVVLLLPSRAYAQMMGGYPDTSTQSADQGSLDETTGKTIWDRLQNGQISCGQLTNDDFDKLGDFFMANMMGTQHDQMDQLITERLGDSGELAMHVAMGKRLSGCNANAPFPNGSGYFMPMMGYGGMMNSVVNADAFLKGGVLPMMGYGYGVGMGGFGFFGLVTWLLLVVFLILGVVYFWKGINGKKR